MIVVHEFILGNSIYSSNILNLPEGHKVIKCDVQHGNITLWILYDNADKYKYVDFKLFATGELIEEGYSYVGTVILDRGALVYHVFEKEVV